MTAYFRHFFSSFGMKKLRQTFADLPQFWFVHLTGINTAATLIKLRDIADNATFLYNK